MMRQSPIRLPKAFAAAIAVAMLLGFVVGCGSDDRTTPTDESGTTTTTTPEDAIVAKTIAQLQTALGLAEDAVTKSKDSPTLSAEGDVVLTWATGTAEVDLDTGLIFAVIQDAPASSEAGAVFSAMELATAAATMAERLGWDAAALAAGGFSPESSGIVDHVEGADEYYVTWAGRDPQGAATGALIDMRLDCSTKDLRSFLVIAAPVPEEEESETED
jgi:hypothetical protein